MRTGTGADQFASLAFRQEGYPFPYLPPTMNAPLSKPGDNYDALGLFQQISRNALAGRTHDFRKYGRRLFWRLTSSSSIATSGAKQSRPTSNGRICKLILPSQRVPV
jgi:hypothetical protein